MMPFVVFAIQASWLLPPSGAAQTRAPVFHSGVEIVALSVTVVDDRQRYVSDLGRADFEVFENGVRRELTLFGGADVPVDIMLLLDVSSSMMPRFDVVRRAALGFIGTLRPQDRAAVMAVGSHVSELQALTHDAARLERAIAAARPTGKTALYDSLYIAANQLERARRTYRESRRQALVLLSDGRDTSSLASEDEAMAVIRRTGAVVFAISPEKRYEFGRLPLSHTRAAAESAFRLTAIAAETGGRAFFLEELDDLADVYADVATELQHQYTLGFEPDNARWGERLRQLLVRVVSHPRVTVRTRRGYDPSR